MFKKISIIGLTILITGCNYFNDTRTDSIGTYPKTRQDQQLDEMGKLTGKDGIVLFGGNKASNGATAGINVNSYLWKAALDIIHKMPLISADPFGGTILTDWYQAHENANERYKINIYIIGEELRSDAVRVTAFKQILDKGNWRDSKANDALSIEIENKILLKARAIKYNKGY